MAAAKELSIKESLQHLYNLQKIHTKIDEINILKGELPMEVSDLEDEIAGLETRMTKLQREMEDFDLEMANRKNAITDAKANIKKYEKQQENVKNSREFDALTKEIEMNKLDIDLGEKKIKEFGSSKETRKDVIEACKLEIEQKKDELSKKKSELDHIISETDKEEKELEKKIAGAEKGLEERLLAAYYHIRKNYRNGLAVVTVERNACGGCYAEVPPQRQSEIKQAKKIIICEHCGRILVDDNMDATVVA
jgi:predicted  nucleic acid-binding Zn-ribbon protein